MIPTWLSRRLLIKRFKQLLKNIDIRCLYSSILDLRVLAMEEASANRLSVILNHIYPPRNLTSNNNQTHNYCSAKFEDGNSYFKIDGTPPVIIGAMILDIHAKSLSQLRPGTTVPGQIKFVSGGVARNVAECMSYLGIKPFIISVIGYDVAGDFLLGHLQSLGLQTEGIRRCRDFSTPTVSNVFDSKGEISVAVADVRAVESALSSDWIERFHDNIRTAPLLMVDANLLPHSLLTACKLATQAETPVWFEPVSIAKSVRVKSVTSQITFVSPNEAELVAIAEGLSTLKFTHLLEILDNHGKLMEIKEMYELFKPAIRILLDEGIKYVALTLGACGVLLCSKMPYISKETTLSTNFRVHASILGRRVNFQDLYTKSNEPLQHSSINCMHYPALQARVKSLIGAGDCFVGGVLAALCGGQDLVESVAFGVAVAKQAVSSELNVPSDLSPSLVSDDACSALLLRKTI